MVYGARKLDVCSFSLSFNTAKKAPPRKDRILLCKWLVSLATPHCTETYSYLLGCFPESTAKGSSAGFS